MESDEAPHVAVGTGIVRALWTLISMLSAGVVWGGLGVVLFAWLGEIADYGSPRLEMVLGPVYEPAMLLAYPVLLASVPVLAVAGVWVASDFGARRGTWNRLTTVALLILAVPMLVVVSAVGATWIVGSFYPAIALLGFGAGYSAVAFVAVCLVVPGVLVTVIALTKRSWGAALLWIVVWGGILGLAFTRVDFTWLPTLPLLLIASAAATIVVLAVPPPNKRIERTPSALS